MSAAIALQLTAADFLKLRKKISTVAWAGVLVLAPLIIYFAVRVAQHSSNPAQHGPAGGIHGYTDVIRILAAIFGPLAAILIGSEAGAADATSGVFRDLVATGRSRLALFAVRAPAALMLTWIIVAIGFALSIAGTFVFASGSPTPSAGLILDGLGFTALSTGVICAIAVGFASLTASRPAALTVLIGWQLVASPILASISSLGSARKLLLSQALSHFSPVDVGRGGREVAMAGGTAVAVIAVWLLVFLALGAWRTRTMDA
jgi:ABC-type transport system involved in multi-copper enzyme maturation permease subunit